MATLVIQLKDIIIDPAKRVDLSSLPQEEAASLIRDSFGFLSSTVEVSIDDDFAVIKLKEEKADKVDKALKLYQRAVKQAEKGEYPKAIKNFENVLETIPQHVDARRNLGMTCLELGDVAKAKEYLRECLQFDPNDGYTNLLLGNIYARHEKNLDVAEFFYQKCLEIKPDDNIMLNNYAGLMMEKGNLEKARELFEKALGIDATYPNTYFGLALLHNTQKRPEAALEILEKLFALPRSKDIRSAPVYSQAHGLYLEINKEIAETAFDRMMALVLDKKRAIEEQGGFPVQVVEDNSLEYVSAVAQMAWKHNREEHIVRYRKKMTAVTPHLISHELEHIALEEEARNEGRNRHFATTAATREISIRAISGHIHKLQKWGYAEDKITDVTLKIIHGVCNQLFNCPLDMFVEHRLHENYGELSHSQFISLHQLQGEALTVLQNKEIKRLTPPLHLPCQYNA